MGEEEEGGGWMVSSRHSYRHSGVPHNRVETTAHSHIRFVINDWKTGVKGSKQINGNDTETLITLMWSVHITYVLKYHTIPHKFIQLLFVKQKHF
jgi:hypothetical protein